MSTELAIIPRPHKEVLISPVMDLTLARSRMQEFQEFVAHYLEPSTDGGQDGGDYGPIPGAGKKKVLLKSGADKLCELYGLYDEYEIQAQEDFATKLFYYKIKCILKSRRDDSVVGTGLGSCSTYESKYRWRDSQRVCPKCEAATIIKGKDEFGGGWLCWAKKGGCGQKFRDGDTSIEGQSIGRVENPDIMDTVNTVLKMAKKRAKIDAVIGVTRSSGLFTQDLDDVAMPEKPAEVVRQELISFKKSAAGNKPQDETVAGAVQAADTPSTAGVKDVPTEGAGSSKTSESPDSGPAASQPAVETITSGQAVNLHKEFRSAVQKHAPGAYLKADEHFYTYLFDHHFLDAKGEPSAGAIPASRWFPVKQAMLQYAKELGQ